LGVCPLPKKHYIITYFFIFSIVNSFLRIELLIFAPFLFFLIFFIFFFIFFDFCHFFIITTGGAKNKKNSKIAKKV